MARRSQGLWWIEENYPPAMIGEAGIMTTDAQYNIFYNDLLCCCCQIFDLQGLPETVDEIYLKFCLLQAGRVAIFRDTKGSGDLLGLDCATANKPNVYYMPTGVIITNPVFKGYSYQLTPGKDCAVIYCRDIDRYNYGRQTGGLFGLISTTAQMLADNTISINVATKNMRLTNLVAADDDNTLKSINIAMQKMYDGEPTIAVQNTLLDKLTAVPLTDHTNTQQLLQLLQVRQYIYAHFYESIGLKTHDQMKKERLITAEIDDGAELAVYNIMDMISQISAGIDEVNRLFGTDITLRVNPLILRTIEAGQAAPTASAPAADGETETETPEDAPVIEEAEKLIAEEMGYSTEPEPEPEPEPEQEPEQDDGSGDGEPEQGADDQTEDGSGDGEPEQDDTQSDDDGSGDTEQTGDGVQIVISGDVAGDITITQGGVDDGKADIP